MTLYHVVVEATLAQPGQHFIEDYLTERDLLPGFRAGMRNVALDEQRHIGFGVKLLADLAREDPEVPDAVARRCCARCCRTAPACFVPPGWDRRYTECFGFTLEEIYEEGGALVREQAARRRDAASRRSPARSRTRTTCRRPSARGAVIAMLAGRAAGRGERRRCRATRRRWRCCSTRCGAASTTAHAPAGPLTLQWDFPDAEPWHLRLDNGSTSAGPGFAPDPDVTYRVRYDDFVDVFAGRLDPRRALATGKLRPRGSCARSGRRASVFG